MPDSQQPPDGRSPALPRIKYTPRGDALLSESRAQAFETRRLKWVINNPQQPYEAYASGEPCRACGRTLLGEPDPGTGTGEETRALVDADNAEFRAEHEACGMGVWHLGNHRTEHCHLCCPFPPLSATQREEIRQLLSHSALRDEQHAAWQVELTCRHIETLASGYAHYVASTVQCTECAVIRGVVKAVRIDGQRDDSASTSSVDVLQPEYHRLTDEQWNWIKHIVRTEEGPHRGRPRTDIRTIVDAARYKIHTGIAWRELPAEFGSWQTASRRHRQLIASYQWDEITQVLDERVPSKGSLEF